MRDGALRSFAPDPIADDEHADEGRGRRNVAEMLLTADDGDRRADRGHGDVGQQRTEQHPTPADVFHGNYSLSVLRPCPPTA